LQCGAGLRLLLPLMFGGAATTTPRTRRGA